MTRAAETPDGAGSPCQHVAQGLLESLASGLLWEWSGKHWPQKGTGWEGLSQTRGGNLLLYLNVRGLWDKAHGALFHSRLEELAERTQSRETVPLLPT